MSYEESNRITEKLCNMWLGNVSKAFQWAFRGLNRLEKAEMLFLVMCEHERNPWVSRQQLESKEALGEVVRSLWGDYSFIGTSHRWEQVEQWRKEHPDSLRFVSLQTASWESGITRVNIGAPDRTHRLKALGNAIVPAVATELIRMILKVEMGRAAVATASHKP